MTPLTSTEPKRADTDADPVHPSVRPSGWALIAGFATFTAVIVLLHFIDTDLDPIDEWVSDYMIGDTGWLMRLGFFSAGVGLVAAANGVARGIVGSRARTVATVGLAIAAVGTFAAGAFETDPPLADGTTGYTTEGALHDLASFVGFAGMIIAGVALRRAFRHDPQWRNAAPVARAFVWLFLIGLIGTIIASEIGTVGRDGVTGLVQRVFLVVPVTAAILLGRRLISLRVRTTRYGDADPATSSSQPA